MRRAVPSLGPPAPRPLSPMYSLNHSVGRLMEIRIWSPVSVEEANSWGRAHNEMVESIEGPYVCFVDLVDATVFPQDIVEAYVSVMKSEERLLRTGTLLSPNEIQGMQIQRMIREAAHPDRRAFRDPDELYDWLSEVLELPERIRLGALLDQTRRRSMRPPAS